MKILLVAEYQHIDKSSPTQYGVTSNYINTYVYSLRKLKIKFTSYKGCLNWEFCEDPIPLTYEYYHITIYQPKMQ